MQLSGITYEQNDTVPYCLAQAYRHSLAISVSMTSGNKDSIGHPDLSLYSEKRTYFCTRPLTLLLLYFMTQITRPSIQCIAYLDGDRFSDLIVIIRA
jgi:hypothetical protein